MSQKPSILKMSGYCLIRSGFVVLTLLIFFSSLCAQSGNDYHVRWIAQFPEEAGEKAPTFRDRISGWVFGQKPQLVTKPFNIVASDPRMYWILDQGTGGVLEVSDGKGELMKSMRKSNKEYSSLVGICLLPEGDMLCTDSRRNLVFQISQDKLYHLFDSLSFNQPTGIAFSAKTDEIWIVETGAHRITVLDREGKVVKRIGGRGSGPGSFNYPTFIWIDKAGFVYIVDSMNFRVQILDQDGNYLSSFGKSGDATGNMARPKGVATDSKGNIYVADALFHVVQIFDREGNFLYSFGGQGQETSEFWMPSGIFIDEEDYIYVADSYNSRVQVFQLVKK